jgi:hypothetical protein
MKEDGSRVLSRQWSSMENQESRHTERAGDGTKGGTLAECAQALGSTCSMIFVCFFNSGAKEQEKSLIQMSKDRQNSECVRNWA